jgi:hypothetical protein
MVVIPVVVSAPESFTDGGGQPGAEDRLAETPPPFPKRRVLARTQLTAAHQIGVVTVALALLTNSSRSPGDSLGADLQRKCAQALAAAERADAEDREDVQGGFAGHRPSCPATAGRVQRPGHHIWAFQGG